MIAITCNTISLTKSKSIGPLLGEMYMAKVKMPHKRHIGQERVKASPGTAIFGWDMLFVILLIADWNKIGDYRQCQTNLNTVCKNSMRIDYDYKVSDKVVLRQDGIFHNAESLCSKKPWTIMTVHTNGTIRIQCGTKPE
jgi:hypothetical protein